LRRINLLPNEIKNQFIAIIKEVDDSLEKANKNLIDNFTKVLKEQAEFIHQILEDTTTRMSAKQVPLILQVPAHEYEGDEQFYSVVQAISENLTIIKNMIQESFNLNQNAIHKIEQTIKKKDEKLNLRDLTQDRDFFLELMSQTEKNTSVQIKALLFEFLEERKDALESQLVIA
jgi:hypothetical protein